MKLPHASYCTPCQRVALGKVTECPECGGAVTRLSTTSKFKNQPAVVDGEWFQSTKEAARWQQLRGMERSGQIADLRRQVPFVCQINGRKICTYVADFVYKVWDCRDGEYQRVVEDVKSPATRRLAVYRLKKELMRACHTVEIREV
jgi:hypothetical protein